MARPPLGDLDYSRRSRPIVYTARCAQITSIQTPTQVYSLKPLAAHIALRELSFFSAEFSLPLRSSKSQPRMARTARTLHSTNVAQCTTVQPTNGASSCADTKQQIFDAKRGALAIDGSYNLIKRSRSGEREFSRWGSSMNSLGLAGRGAILALGTLMSMVTVSCGLIEELSGSEQDSAAVVPSPTAAFGSGESPPFTDAVIPPRLPGMIGASRPIHLKGKSTALQLVDVLSRDSIPAIDNPTFLSSSEASSHLSGDEFVIGLSIGDEQRAYPTAFLSSHEIVNDVVGGMPVAVTW